MWGFWIWYYGGLGVVSRGEVLLFLLDIQLFEKDVFIEVLEEATLLKVRFIIMGKGFQMGHQFHVMGL